MAGHSHGASSDAYQHDRDSDEVSDVFAPQTQDDGHTYIRHCKDTLDGAGLVPAQPFQLPIAASIQLLATVVNAHPAEPLSALDNYLPPPFQPPQFGL